MSPSRLAGRLRRLRRQDCRSFLDTKRPWRREQVSRRRPIFDTSALRRDSVRAERGGRSPPSPLVFHRRNSLFPPRAESSPKGTPVGAPKARETKRGNAGGRGELEGGGGAAEVDRQERPEIDTLTAHCPIALLHLRLSTGRTACSRRHGRAGLGAWRATEKRRVCRRRLACGVRRGLRRGRPFGAALSREASRGFCRAARAASPSDAPSSPVRGGSPCP